MINGRVFIDCFTSLDDLPKKLYGDDMAVLKALSKSERFSCFEMTGKLHGTIKRLERRGLLKIDTTTPYPWTNTPLTVVGKAMLHEGAEMANITDGGRP